MEYELELEKAAEKIKEEKAKLVCIQLPAGLKPKAAEIQHFLEGKTDAKIVIWAGSCFGSCDIPVHIEKLGVDLIIHWGHSQWQ